MKENFKTHTTDPYIFVSEKIKLIWIWISAPCLSRHQTPLQNIKPIYEESSVSVIFLLPVKLLSWSTFQFPFVMCLSPYIFGWLSGDFLTYYLRLDYKNVCFLIWLLLPPTSICRIKKLQLSVIMAVSYNEHAVFKVHWFWGNFSKTFCFRNVCQWTFPGDINYFMI